eukprot:CAMPEP_0170144518 /NCGR_PEP_ID=MMETSP0033_2-20121228/14153_1 /TAXON_ID=195969 /ORGANISM="Dolichomastix tenuilepis, Strain CCMP3274" /LENGTH=140 /DNA_ID=CAMNT_0010381023 /DNA_START=39 /DNA_END=458 /DNA_ORIENTATION=-
MRKSSSSVVDGDVNSGARPHGDLSQHFEGEIERVMASDARDGVKVVVLRIRRGFAVWAEAVDVDVFADLGRKDKGEEPSHWFEEKVRLRVSGFARPQLDGALELVPEAVRVRHHFGAEDDDAALSFRDGLSFASFLRLAI